MVAWTGEMTVTPADSVQSSNAALNAPVIIRCKRPRPHNQQIVILRMA